MSVNIPVLIEESGELVQLKLTPENAEKAKLDPAYLQELINEQFSRRSEQFIAQEMQAQSSPAQSGHGDAAIETGSGNDVSGLFIWTPKCIDLFLALYEDNMEIFDSGSQRHKKIWTKISIAMKENGYNVTWAQCQSKLTGLKRTYNKIIDHNNVSGNGRKNWPHFSRMHEIFGTSGWVQPKAVATEAGPVQSTTTCSGEPKCDQTPKKRKPVIDLEICWSEIKAERKAMREQKERRRVEVLKEKNDKINEMLERKKEQHAEKMKMMGLWLQAITGNTPE